MLQKIALSSDFMHIFHDSPWAGADNPLGPKFFILYMYIAPGDEVLISTEMSYHFIHFLQVSKNFL